MRRYTAFKWMLPLLLAVCAVGCGSAGNDAAPAELDLGPPAWEDELLDMAVALGLSIEEEDAVRAAYEARDAEVEAFLESERGRGLLADEAALKEAARSRNLSEVRAITARAGDDRDALRQIIADGERRIRDALPEDKRVAWDARLVSNEMISVMEPLSLTDEQRWQIEGQAVTTMEGAFARNEPNPKAWAFLALEEWAEVKVLTADQRQAYEAVKKANPLRSLRF